MSDKKPYKKLLGFIISYNKLIVSYYKLLELITYLEAITLKAMRERL